MTELVRLCDVDAVADDSMHYVEVLGCDYIVVKREGEIYVLDGTCTYDWSRLDEGTLEGDVVTCPGDGGQFNVKTGEVVQKPPTFPLSTYEVTLKDDAVWAPVTGY